MAVVVALCAIFVLHYLHETKGTSVELTVPVHPVTVGGILALQCQIQDMEESYTVKILRDVNERTEELTTDLTYGASLLGQRVFVTKRAMSGGILVYFMTIVDMAIQDRGEYSCIIFNISGRKYATIAEASTDVDVYYLPDSIYPQCQSTPAEIGNLHENVDIRLSCLSSSGQPTVALQWKTNTNLDIASRNLDRDDTISSEINLRTNKEHDGVVFICEMTSSGFPDLIRTCHIGPITIRRNVEKETPNILPPVVIATTSKPNTLISDDCTTECPENKYTILYLSVATIGAAMLCLVFLTTTVIWCYKYNKISSEAHNGQRNVTASDGSEPVYVSLQRRHENDRNSMFMTVEDPSNPGSKVLMPKEVFDEFYSSLSLKKNLSPKHNVQV
ncbi:uncharacterized protein [Amphiura filiformis]|uniref:uncharacterized protein n=1 Tax=Amphiura filiformis TaxID=82378 RepID=UPI003B20F0DF